MRSCAKVHQTKWSGQIVFLSFLESMRNSCCFHTNEPTPQHLILSRIYHLPTKIQQLDSCELRQKMLWVFNFFYFVPKFSQNQDV